MPTLEELAELSERYYSEKQIDKIVTAVRVPISAAARASLRRELNSAAYYYLSSKDDPTPAQLRNHLADIEKAAQKLLSVLGTGNITRRSTSAEIELGLPTSMGEALQIAADDELSENGQPFTQSSSEMVSRAILGIGSLQRLASRALVEAKKNVKPHGKTRDDQRLLFLGVLAEIYRKIFDEEPRVSRGRNQKPGGPFLCFVETCLVEIGEKRSLERVVQLAKQAKDFDTKFFGIGKYRTGEATVISRGRVT